jgi:hypothetical protein
VFSEQSEKFISLRISHIGSINSQLAHLDPFGIDVADNFLNIVYCDAAITHPANADIFGFNCAVEFRENLVELILKVDSGLSGGGVKKHGVFPLGVLTFYILIGYAFVVKHFIKNIFSQ